MRNRLLGSSAMADPRAEFVGVWKTEWDALEEQGLLYAIDMTIFDGFKPREVDGLTRFTPGTVTLLQQNPDTKDLTPIAVRVSEPARGLSRVAVEVGSETVPQLKAGEATVRVTAERAATWLRHPDPVVRELKLPVRLTPPQVKISSSQIYLAQGGSSVVVYQVGETAARDGVRVAGGQAEGPAGGGQVEQLWFSGYPLPGGEAQDRFALFGAPHDLEDASEIRLQVADELGNELEVAFLDKYLRKPLSTDTIRLSDRFMAKVVPEIIARSPGIEDQGALLASYLAINRDLRRINTEKLLELAARSTPRFLWNQPFRQLPNTQSMASFADRRTYLYDGREVDQQDHLGFDLASVRRAPVLAANRGIVLMAEYFGIYGNTVVLDHGYGLMSLYAHLSSLDVQPDQEVARGETLGATGETGLAGGDHLHFSMLLHGLQVNPLEWWDPLWIENRVAGKLGSALVLER